MTVFGYTRISVDLNEDDRENTSIENQKKIIQDYVAQQFPTAELIFFQDRDRSGYTFAQREDYQRMRRRLLSGEVSTLVLKDFSRFSRRNSLGLLELETLRDKGVRIISIGDSIDYPTKDDWMLIQFKFLMNEMPVTDTSKKIKQLIASKQKSGKWVCAVPYGYRLINTKEMIYEIDPPAAEVVREIFALYNNGWGYKSIANQLTDRGVPTPRANEIAWKETNGRSTKRKAKDTWSIVSVMGILRNDFYIGTLRQHKYTRKKINGTDLPIDESQQIVLENAHTPILDTRTFLYAQEQLRLRSRSNYRGVKKYPCDYSGFLFCGDCGEPMFSRSRPDLRPAYICSTYMKRGTKGCTSHHTPVDLLDGVLKRYIGQVRNNSAALLQQLEEAVKQQPEREQEIGSTLDGLEQQLENARSQLKVLYKRKLLDTMHKGQEQAAIIEETYRELEQELLERIGRLENRIRDSIDSRNRLIQVNRKAKTVMDVLNGIFSKEKLDKQDVGLIVDRFDIYEEHLDIRLKADVDELLRLGGQPYTETILKTGRKHRAKPLAVNVVNKGDPLEIYTSKEGEVIFKKYSLMEGLTDFAGQLCETLNKTTGHVCVITDRDLCVAVSGVPRRELLEKPVSEGLESVMESRKLWQHQPGVSPMAVSEGNSRLFVSCAAPILAEGDILGCVLFAAAQEDLSPTETDCKLLQTVSGFLGRHMET